jgi:hypothetical protein
MKTILKSITATRHFFANDTMIAIAATIAAISITLGLTISVITGI